MAEPEHVARAGFMDPVDEAFYRLAIKERNFERVKVDRLEAQLAEAVALLREVANAGVAFDDRRLGYAEVQIDRETWTALTAFRGQ